MKRLLLAAACAALVFGAIGCSKSEDNAAATDNKMTAPSTDNAAPPAGAPAGGAPAGGAPAGGGKTGG